MGIFSRKQTEEPARRRDPRGATKLLRWSGRGLPQVEEWDAEQAYRKGYILNAFTYAAVNAIASDLAVCPFRTSTELPDDPALPHDYDKNSRLAQLLGPPPLGPAPSISARRLWGWTVKQRLITGRTGWEIEGNVTALWPLVSQYLKAVPTTGGKTMWAGFEYGAGLDLTKYNAEQIFYSWIPSQHDFRLAESPLQAARLNIDLAVNNDLYNWSFFRNDAAPATMVTHQRIDEADERNSWRDQFKSGFKGPEKAGSVMFNEVDADQDGKVLGTVAIERLGLSQKDAEMAVQYRQSIQAILVALGVPLSRLMDASGRTFSNAGEEMEAYWNSTIKNLAVDLAEDVNSQIAPRIGNQYGWFDMSDIGVLKPREDKPFAVSGLPELVASRIVTREWAAEQVGADPEDVPDEDPVVLEELPVSEEIPPELRTRDRKLREIKAINRRVEYLEARWEQSMRAVFTRQASSVMAKLDSSRGRKVLSQVRADEPTPDVNAVFDFEHWTTETEAVALGLYADVADQAVIRTIENLAPEAEVDQDNITLRVKNILDTKALLLSGQVTETTRVGIQKALVEGVQAGEGSDLIAKRVQAVFVEAKGYRAKLIARTEVIGSYNQASLETAKLLPRDVVDSKAWLATDDARTRPAHAAADGQIQPLETPFNVGGELIQHPSEPNCRCAILLGLREDLENN